MSGDEDDSMNEAEIEGHEEEEEDDDSSSESVDEEIKLNQNFITTLQKISIEGKIYEDYILLLDIAYDLKDLDKIRQSIELFACEFPLSPIIWLKYINIELNVASTDDELDKVSKLFQRALGDYYSIDVALEYAEFAARLTAERAREVWDVLLPAYGYEFTKGRLMWEAWRAYFNKSEPEDTPEKVRRMVKKYKEELLLPLSDMQVTYTSFRDYLEKYGSLLERKFDREAFELEVKDTKKIFQKVLPFEQKLAKLHVEAHRERVEIFRQYIAECAEELEEEFVQVLYERMISACCLNETAWILYVNFIQNRSSDWSPLESNKSKIFVQTDLDVINRGLRNCSWSSALYVEKMRVLESRNEPRTTIQGVLEQAVQVHYKSPAPIVKIWMEYLTYLARVTNYSDEKQTEILRNNFNLAWDTLGRQYGNLADSECEILRFWGTIEYTKLKDFVQGKQLWNTVLESSDNSLMTALWIEFSQLEFKYRGADAARLVLKRALKVHDLNDVPSLVSYWTRFERCNGTLEYLRECQKVCEKILQQYQRRNYNKKDGNKRKMDDAKKDNNKRKTENQIADNEPKTKKHKDGAAEDFRKLSINAPDVKKPPVAADTETMDESKDGVQVFLSNLDSNVSLEDLRETFPEINVINFQLISRGKGKNGFGYAELANESEVKQALSFDRRLLGGRPVFISPCQRERASRSHGFKYSTSVEPNKIFIKGLSFDATEGDLRGLFGRFGTIKDIRIVINKYGKSKGIAYIEYEEESSAKSAVAKLDQVEFHDRKLTVAISQPPTGDKSKLPLPASSSGSKQPPLRVSEQKSFVPRPDQKSRISFIPASVQKATFAQPPSTTASPKQPEKSNEDFRKMLMK